MNLQHWQLSITPLSPVHMGADADYEPTGYVIEDGVLYEFDSLSALSVLPEVERKRLASILNGRSNQGMLSQVQSFFHGNRDRMIAASGHQVQVSPTVEAFYEERVGRVSQHEQGGGKVQNKLEIERTAWNPVTNQAVLPGSGLKGAVRTALLNAVNNGRPLDYSLKKDRQANRRLQQDIFQGSFHTDPLRLIHMGDASLEEPQNFATQVRFALNRKKQAVTDSGGNLRQSKAEQAGLYQLLECLPAMQPRAFIGSLSIQHETGMPEEKWPSIQFSLPEIAKACNQFYHARLREELTLLKKRGYIDKAWSDRLDFLMAQGWLREALEENRAFLLRIGRHSGAESVTLNGLRNIKIMKGKGERPDYLDQAKTIWLAGDERQLQTNLLPFGWLLVEIAERNKALPGWPRAEESSRQNTVDFSDWLKQIRKRQSKLRQEIANQRTEDEIRAREAAEREAEKQRRKEEEAQRLNSLSPLERELEGIIQNEKNNNPGAVLLNRLKGGQWEIPDDQKTVATKIKALWEAEKKWLPDFSGSNKQKVKQRARCREVLAFLNT